MKNRQIIVWKEFITYFVVGSTTVFIDWSLFAIMVYGLGFHYQVGLVVAYISAGFFHFFSNKKLTFKCPSKRIGSQYSLYAVMTLTSMVASMGVIAVMIDFFMLNKMIARILTTGLMLLPNYLIHKNITFSKKIFAS